MAEIRHLPTAVWHCDRNFERMVNADMRDSRGIGTQYAVLRRKENRVRWLHTLISIRQSIISQNAHDNARLRSHPDRTAGGRPSKAYVDAKSEIADRKAKRERAMRVVNERIGEARRLIGAAPIARSTAGAIVCQLLEADAFLHDGGVEEARRMLAGMVRALSGEEAASDVR